MNLDANLAQLAAFVFGLTAALRGAWPTLDGRLVWALALILGAVVAYVTATDVHAYRAMAWQGLQIGGGAIAMASGGSYIAGKIGAAIAPPVINVSPKGSAS